MFQARLMNLHSNRNIFQVQPIRCKIPFFVLLLVSCIFLTKNSHAQMQGLMNRVTGAANGGGGGGRSGGGGSDSLQFEKRKFSDDSVNVRFRYLDTARFSGFDSTIDDYFKRVPLKADLIYLGNNGTATRPILFSPLRGPGWDAGFHALDVYSFNIAETKFMNTTKPYTQLGFLVGSKAEQNLDVVHTQNATPDLNFVIHYRLINAPGAFNSQNTNHNNIRFNSDFSSKNKRYHAFLILMSNALQSSENGGITDEKFLVNPNGAYNDRFNIPTNLASALYTTRNFFNVKLYTGNRYTDKQILLRQQYDFGKKDSIVTDSTVVKYFLPRIRFEHTIHQLNYNYKYLDIQADDASTFYKNNYGLAAVPKEISYSQQWKLLKNDFSIIQFPDPKNPLQFFKAGLTYINLSSDTGSLNNSFINLVAHGEYRNRTKNKKWDMLLSGELYAAGRDAGNYMAQAKLQTDLGKKVGFFEIGFKNINRSPSYLYTYKNIFPLVKKSDFNDENVISIDASLFFQPIKARLTFNYFLVSNYTYFTDFNKIAQSPPIFNFVRIGIEKEFSLSKHWKWRVEAYLQSVAGSAPIHLPWFYTRNRIAYEANPFRNLFIATGLEVRYYTNYYADGYSPVLGQFFYQSKQKISILPEATGYMNFRVRSFTSFIRVENLNTATTQYGFGFKNSNLAAPLYAMPGMVFRLGVFWNFVN